MRSARRGRCPWGRLALAVAVSGLCSARAADGAVPDFSRRAPEWQTGLDAPAAPAIAESIVASGQGAALACSNCHGSSGIPAAGLPFPRLAGMSAEYLAKQLVDYRNGTRDNAMMGAIAKALSDAEIGALARHYAAVALPSPRSATSNAADRGARLMRVGDNALALPACANCHGANADGVGVLLPPLAGQPAAYTDAQLRAYASGTRRNDDNGVMRSLAHRLADSDIKALADYLAGTP